MPSVTNDELTAFQRAFDACCRRIGGGKVAVESDQLRAIVKKNPQAAYRFVEIHCVMAQSQPGYLQPALTVAAAYQVEMEDDCLMRMVSEKTERLGAEEHLAAIRFGLGAAARGEECPERLSAREWWKGSERESGLCDDCRALLRRGEGYLITGRRVMLGDRVVDLGEELICGKCFERIRGGDS